MKWKAEYATGIHNIDNQHRTIVGFITQFESMAETEAHWNDAHRLILRTREFMEFHFCVEESLMQILPYPDSAAHRAGHQHVLRQIAQLEDRVFRENMRDELAPLMRNCLIDHIVGGDKWFAQYAIGLYGHRPPGGGNDRRAELNGRF
jgi:hemerythrin-like metal-binding protein